MCAGWLTPGHPDPNGARLAVVRRALCQLDHIEGLFWECALGGSANPDAAPPAAPPAAASALTREVGVCPRSFASLYQTPKTEEQGRAFKCALG